MQANLQRVGPENALAFVVSSCLIIGVMFIAPQICTKMHDRTSNSPSVFALDHRFVATLASGTPLRNARLLVSSRDAGVFLEYNPLFKSRSFVPHLDPLTIGVDVFIGSGKIATVPL